MAWQTIAASETDANSPLNQTLMGKIRGNLDKLGDNTSGHSHSGAAAGEGPKIHQGGLQTSIQEVMLFRTGPGAYSANYVLSSVGSYGFWPQVKVDNGALVDNIDLRVLVDLDSAPVSYTTYINLSFNITSNVQRTLFAGVRYIQASRDEPVVWLLRKKSTGEIIGSIFDPEASGLSHPFADQEDNPDSDLEVAVLELKRDDMLRFHLFKNLTSFGLLWQVKLGLALGVIKLKEQVAPLLEAPSIMSKDVKVLDFDFFPEKVK